MSGSQSSVIEGNVAEIISKTQLIITPGKDENIKVGDTFQIIAEEKDRIRDPFTQSVLEEIPVIKATVTVIIVHEKCSTVVNSATRTEQQATGLSALMGVSGQTRTVTIVADLPVGDNTMDRVDRTIKVSDQCVKF